MSKKQETLSNFGWNTFGRELVLSQIALYREPLTVENVKTIIANVREFMTVLNTK